MLGEKLATLGMTDVREKIVTAIEEEILDAVKFAEESPFPDLSTASDYVYA